MSVLDQADSPRRLVSNHDDSDIALHVVPIHAPLCSTGFPGELRVTAFHPRFTQLIVSRRRWGMCITPASGGEELHLYHPQVIKDLAVSTSHPWLIGHFERTDRSFPLCTALPAPSTLSGSRRPDRPQPPCRRGLPGAPPQEPSGPPKFLTLLSTHTTLFVDPDRPSGNSPKRFLCVGFWGVKPIAVCMSRDHGAVSSFRECGLPYGLRGALCTLHPCCSVCTSFTGATLGRSGWLDLPPQGLTPCKKHQASLGALTPGALTAGCVGCRWASTSSVGLTAV